MKNLLNKIKETLIKEIELSIMLIAGIILTAMFIAMPIALSYMNQLHDIEMAKLRHQQNMELKYGPGSISNNK